MQAMGGGPTTPIEQVTELGESVMEKLIAAGITTGSKPSPDMTAEELSEIPGNRRKKPSRKISVAVRHYFGQYEEGEERPAPKEPVAVEPTAEELADIENEESSMAKSPEETSRRRLPPLAKPKKSRLSTEDLVDAEDAVPLDAKSLRRARRRH